MDGLKEWLAAVCTARIPCAIVSSLDRRKVVEALKRMRLNTFFQVDTLFILDLHSSSYVDNQEKQDITIWLQLSFVDYGT